MRIAKKIIIGLTIVATLSIGLGDALAAPPQIVCSNLKPVTVTILDCSETSNNLLEPLNLDAKIQNLYFTPELFRESPSNQFGKLRNDILDLVNWAAQKVGLSPNLVGAVAQAESGGNPSAVSQVGAMGVMQLMPETASSLGVNPYNPEQNILGGAKYLRNQIDHFGGDIPMALAAYNAGPGAVEKYGGVPPYKETRDFVTKVMILAGGIQ